MPDLLDQMHRSYLDSHLALVPNCVRELLLIATFFFLAAKTGRHGLD